MNKRECVLALLALATMARPGASSAQARGNKIARVGMLFGFPGIASLFVSLRATLRDLGWVEGTNVEFDERIAAQPSELPLLVAEMLRRSPDVFVVANLEAPIVLQATRSIPIVVGGTLDPVEAGLAQSVNRPGGTVTGVLWGEPRLAAKMVQLLHEAVPAARRLAMLHSEGFPGIRPYVDAYKAAADAQGLDFRRFAVRNSEEVTAALAAIDKARVDSVLLVPNGLIALEIDRILKFAVERRLPVASPNQVVTERGGLLSFGSDLAEVVRRVASLVDKILRGANPADLPFEYPTRYELIVNVQTARALGLKLPQSILLRARLIE